MENTSARDRIMDAAEKLVYENGFNATSLNAILGEAGASKGAFFHHFTSKEVLGEALLDRYAAADSATLEEFMTEAESMSGDPAEQIVTFVSLFEEAADDIAAEQPGCLFASFIYERGPGGGREDDVIIESVQLWRNRILEKLQKVSAESTRLDGADLPSLADQVYSTFEGGFILARATNDPSHLRRQLAHLRRYFELLLGVETPVVKD